MSTLDLIVSLFPIIFMFHEFEEIIFLKHWALSDGDYVICKYPFTKRLLSHVTRLSTSSFSLAVFEEFIIVSISVFLSLFLGWNYLWLSVFTAFSIHIVVHIFQWIVVRRYIPVIVTSFLSLPYIFWGVYNVFQLFSLKEIVVCTVLGFVLLPINLYLAHKLSAWFESRVYK